MTIILAKMTKSPRQRRQFDHGRFVIKINKILKVVQGS
jgi:hypothetical protein